jgi:microcystin degradation protein MlrC
MNIFVAGLMMETSSFSAIPTTRRAFDNPFYYRPATLSPVPEPRAYELLGYGAFLRKAREKGYGAYTSTHAFAEPAAPCRQADYEALRDEILSDLAQAMPVDMVFLFLHGAQMAQGYDDCEGDIIERIRSIVGPEVFIGIELDLHGNVSPKMLEMSDALVACRFYPHTDFDERAEHLFEIGDRHARGDIRARNYFCRVPMLGMFYTTLPRMQAVDRRADELEGAPGVHSVSLMHGFPWSDQPDTGAGVIVVAEPGRTDVPEMAFDLAQDFFAARDETGNLRQRIDAILDRIASEPGGGAFVIADTADNAGGGAGGDSTFILRRLLERGVDKAALGMIWDPIAADFAHDAGVGSTFNLRLGGKTGPFAGDPLDVVATVRALSGGIEQEDPAGGVYFAIGRAALLEVEGVAVVVNSARQQVYDPVCFTGLGVDLAAMRVIVVKSSQHFHERFAPLAADVFYCETPGSLTLDFDESFYRRLTRPIWPLDHDARPVLRL